MENTDQALKEKVAAAKTTSCSMSTSATANKESTTFVEQSAMERINKIQQQVRR